MIRCYYENDTMDFLSSNNCLLIKVVCVFFALSQSKKKYSSTNRTDRPTSHQALFNKHPRIFHTAPRSHTKLVWRFLFLLVLRANILWLHRNLKFFVWICLCFFSGSKLTNTYKHAFTKRRTHIYENDKYRLSMVKIGKVCAVLFRFASNGRC